MRVIIKKPLKAPQIINISNDISNLQCLLGGYVEAVTFAEGIVLLVDEEAKRRPKAFNFHIGYDFIMGTAIFCGSNGEEFTDLSDDDAKKVLLFLAKGRRMIDDTWSMEEILHEMYEEEND